VTFEKLGGGLAVIRVAIVVTVNQLRRYLSQIAFFDGLLAHYAGGLPARRSSIHKYESHVAPPGEKHISARFITASSSRIP
jgi:hypothetical protein